jgi:thioredoxin-like negative regulator of GroEL
MKSVFYFTADWCNPCKKVKPVVEELNRENLGTMFYIIDADIETELAKKFEIRSVPTFILMQDGVEINRITGAKTREELLEFING